MVFGLGFVVVVFLLFFLNVPQFLPLVVMFMVLWGLVLFPVWLLSLGLLLARVDQAMTDLELEEQRMIPPPANVIDDIDVHDLQSP